MESRQDLRAAACIDGFNLYYGLRSMRKRVPRHAENRWLDVCRLAGALAKGARLVTTRYFTARIRGRDHDPDAPQRQDVYLRALGTLPGLTIHYGNFLTSRARLPLVGPQPGVSFADVYRTEEKGSDVNLATYLLPDAFRDEYDLAIIVSNDSDLVEPVRVVREELGKRVMVASPQEKVTARLQAAASESRVIRPNVVLRCQLPVPVVDAEGRQVRPPAAWGPVEPRS